MICIEFQKTKKTLEIENGVIEQLELLADKTNQSFNDVIRMVLAKGVVLALSIEDDKLELATVDVGVSFITFWDMYDKKVGKPKCEKKWDKLPVKERKAILDYLPLYKQSQPDKRYRKNPETFLNNRSWEDELIIAPAEPNTLDKLTSLF